MLRALILKISKLSLFFLVDYFLLRVDRGSDIENCLLYFPSPMKQGLERKTLSLKDSYR